MVQDHKWSWSDIQNMFPFERDINAILLNNWVEEKNEEVKRLAAK